MQRGRPQARPKTANLQSLEEKEGQKLTLNSVLKDQQTNDQYDMLNAKRPNFNLPGSGCVKFEIIKQCEVSNHGQSHVNEPPVAGEIPDSRILGNLVPKARPFFSCTRAKKGSTRQTGGNNVTPALPTRRNAKDRDGWPKWPSHHCPKTDN